MILREQRQHNNLCPSFLVPEYLTNMYLSGSVSSPLLLTDHKSVQCSLTIPRCHAVGQTYEAEISLVAMNNNTVCAVPLSWLKQNYTKRWEEGGNMPLTSHLMKCCFCINELLWLQVLVQPGLEVPLLQLPQQQERLLAIATQPEVHPDQVAHLFAVLQVRDGLR